VLPPGTGRNTIATASRSAYYRRLVALGAADFPHVAGMLGPHLLRTAALLDAWGNRPALCVAGLYHAVYGTDGIHGCLVGPDGRHAIAAIIGEEAEAIAYRFGACDRDAFHPRIGTPAMHRFVDRFTHSEYPIDEPALRDFCELTLANEAELGASNEAFRVKHRDALAGLAARMAGLVSAAALAACASDVSIVR